MRAYHAESLKIRTLLELKLHSQIIEWIGANVKYL